MVVDGGILVNYELLWVARTSWRWVLLRSPQQNPVQFCLIGLIISFSSVHTQASMVVLCSHSQQLCPISIDCTGSPLTCAL